MIDDGNPREFRDGREYATVKIAFLIGMHAAVALTLSLAGHAGALRLTIWWLAVTIGFFVSQLALTAVWAALGRTPRVLRCLAMLAVAIWVATLVAVMISEASFPKVLPITVETSLLVFLGFWALRLYAGPANLAGENLETPPRLQFTLLQLFLAMLLVAVSIAVAPFAGALVHALPRRGLFQPLAIYFVIAAWPAAWLALTGPRLWLWIIPAFAAACLGFAVALHFAFGWRFNERWVIGAGMMSEATFTYLSLCIVRWAGYGWSGGFAGRQLRSR